MRCSVFPNDLVIALLARLSDPLAVLLMDISLVPRPLEGTSVVCNNLTTFVLLWPRAAAAN